MRFQPGGRLHRAAESRRETAAGASTVVREFVAHAHTGERAVVDHAHAQTVRLPRRLGEQRGRVAHRRVDAGAVEHHAVVEHRDRRLPAHVALAPDLPAASRPQHAFRRQMPRPRHGGNAVAGQPEARVRHERHRHRAGRVELIDELMVLTAGHPPRPRPCSRDLLATQRHARFGIRATALQLRHPEPDVEISAAAYGDRGIAEQGAAHHGRFVPDRSQHAVGEIEMSGGARELGSECEVNALGRRDPPVGGDGHFRDAVVFAGGHRSGRHREHMHASRMLECVRCGAQLHALPHPGADQPAVRHLAARGAPAVRVGCLQAAHSRPRIGRRAVVGHAVGSPEGRYVQLLRHPPSQPRSCMEVVQRDLLVADAGGVARPVQPCGVRKRGESAEACEQDRVGCAPVAQGAHQGRRRGPLPHAGAAGHHQIPQRAGHANRCRQAPRCRDRIDRELRRGGAAAVCRHDRMLQIDHAGGEAAVGGAKSAAAHGEALHDGRRDHAEQP